MHYTTNYQSPISAITLASDGENLTGLWMDGQKYHGAGIIDIPTTQENLPVFAQTKDWLDQYFEGEKPDLSSLPLAPFGSTFRCEVWKILCKIPHGEYITYGEIARQIAAKANKSRMSSQAVGGAVGHNPISIIIPCHRVIGANGNLTGYAGGIDKKIKLLVHEGVDISRFFIPKTGAAL